MSNIYIQEPPTNGKVLLKTSCGELDIELWSKEAPKACRNFVQLCMEGYYNGTIFHRIIRDFMAQGGDPTGTGEGGESIYGHPFKDEFHSRLRFVRRGLLAMANGGPHDNGSQFFITLGACEHLQNKHTIFGKITGNTVYNSVKLGEVEIGEDDRPMYPPKIKSTEILANPFDDIIPRQVKKKDKEEKKAKSRSKATKNFSLLSFGEEAEEDEEEVVYASQAMKNKSKSMHDLVNDPKLSSVPAVDLHKERRKSSDRLSSRDGDEDENDTVKEEEEEEEERGQGSREAADKVRSKLVKEKKKKKAEPDKEHEAPPPPPEVKPLSKKEELMEESRKLKAELREGKKRKHKEEEEKEKKLEKDAAAAAADDEKDEKEAPGNDELADFHAQKKKFKSMKKTMAKKGGSREEQTLAMLAKFQNKLHSAILNKKPEPERETDDKEEGEYEEEKQKKEGEEEEQDDWLGHSLQFENHEGKVKDANIKDADTFTIFDPRNPMNQRRREESKNKRKEKR